MDAALKELGRRLAARRSEAGFSIAALAKVTRVPVERLQQFEAGGGGLAVGALARIARALGVAEASFFHTSAPESPAIREPSLMLSEVGQAASLSPDDQELLASQLHRARRFAELGDLLGIESLTKSFRPTRAKKSKPYRAGYDLAGTVRSQLGLDRAPVHGLQRIIENRFSILVVEHAFADRRVQAASCRSGSARLVALSPSLKYETSRRTILAHELCHHLVDLGDEGVVADEAVNDDGFSLDRSPEERRARAFAVMFLAPSDAIRETLGAPSNQISIHAAPDIVTRLRGHFGIGFEAMAWHLFHLGYYSFHEDDVAKLSSYGDGLDIAGFEDETGKDGLQRRVHDALRHDAISGERARTILGEYAPAMA